MKKLTLILAILLLCGCINGCAMKREVNESAAENIPTLKVGMLGKSIKPVGVLAADAKGYFAEEGVNIEFVPVSSMNDAYVAVSNGDLDVYLFSSTAAATFISQGTTSLRVFGGTVGEGSEIMAKAGTPKINSVEDLIGKTIACQMPETGQMALKSWLLDEGYSIGAPGEGADISFLYVNDANVAIEGCVKGEYDYCITNSCLGYYAAGFGAELVGTVKQFVGIYPCCRQTCSQKAYEEKFDALVAFERANLRGYKFYLENQEETLDILVDYTGQDRNFMQAQMYGTGDYTPVMRVSLDPDKKACIDFYEAMVKIGEIDGAVEVNWADYVVTDIYSTALNDLAEAEADVELWGELQIYHADNN